MDESNTFAATLQSVVSTAQVTTETDILYQHTVDGVIPRLVVTPSTVDEVAQVVAMTHKQGLRVLPRGGGSQMNLGGLAQQIDVLLKTNKLTRLLEHEAPDLTCHVESGITLATLQ